MPSFFSFAITAKPGRSVSTMKALMPLCFCSGSAIAKTISRSAWAPLVMKFFIPLSTQSSPSRTARVCWLAASVPAFGSLRQKAPSFSPFASGVRKSRFCAASPYVSQRPADQAVVHRHDHAGAGAGLRDLLHRDHVADRVEPGAAVLGRHVHAHEAELAELLHHLRGEALLAVDRGGDRRHLAGGEIGGQLLDRPLLFGQAEVHGPLPASGVVVEAAAALAAEVAGIHHAAQQRAGAVLVVARARRAAPP